MRATLLPRAQTATLVLTFDHRIADGAAGLRVLEDLVALLNGNHLAERAVPTPQEELIDALPSPRSSSQAEVDGEPDPRLIAPGQLSSPDGSRPEVTTAGLDEAMTARLVHTCRGEGATVHAALCAAATQALIAAGRDYVRIVSPKDLRRNVGLSDDVALRLLPSRTGFSREHAVDFWPLARATAEAIAPTRSVEGVKRMSQMIAANPVADADGGAAGMMAASSLDMMLTNLGRVTFAASGPIEVTAIYGLVMVVGFVDEQILGVTTFRDRLRMTNVTHAPIPGLLDGIVARLLAAIKA